MTTSNEAIAAAREIIEQIPWNTLIENKAELLASIIQKHYAAKYVQIKHLRQELALARIPTTVDAVEREEWRQERDQLKARVAELEKALKSNVEWHELNDEYGGYPESELCEINCKALTSTPSSSLTRLQELERKAKALDWYWKEYYRISVMFDPKERKVAIVYCSICCEYKETLFEAIENAMEKQK